MRPKSVAALGLALACQLAGCAAESAKPPPTSVRPGDPTVRLVYPRAGIRLAIPRLAQVQKSRSPGVFRSSLGQASVAVFAYPRREQLPRSGAELAIARRRLVREIRHRGRRVHVIRSKARRVARARALEVIADQTISRLRLRSRSLHVFKGRGEYVIDMLAPAGSYRSTNRTYFTPLVRSLRLSGRIAAARRRR